MGDKVSWNVKTARFVLPFAAMLSLAAFARHGDDYQAGVAASSAARAYFKAVPQKLESKKVSRRAPAAADEDGAYFVYNAECSEEDYEKLVEGQKIKVTGYKSEWSGEIEIVDAAVETEPEKAAE